MNPPLLARSALVLFAHGARDQRWAEPLLRVQKLIESRVDARVEVHLAFLELMAPSLPELVGRLVAAQVGEITIIPVFLGQGGHVRSDLPILVQKLELSYPLVKFTLAPAIGEHPAVLNAIAEVCISSLD